MVHFDARGGTLCPDVPIRKGATLGSLDTLDSLSGLPSPTRDYSHLVGWFLENGEKASSETVINEDTILYAKWRIRSEDSDEADRRVDTGNAGHPENARGRWKRRLWPEWVRMLAK